MGTRILVVDDEPATRRLIEAHLQRSGFDVAGAGSATEARDAIQENEFQMAVLDVILPDGYGIDIMREIHVDKPELPVIMITAHSSVEVAVEAMRYGAYDFCSKPVDFNRLDVSVKNALEAYNLKKTLEVLTKTNRSNFCGIVGSSHEMQVIYQMIENVAPTKATVMITGESGTGKELIARAIHMKSPRSHREMVDVNCAAIPKELLESELFGHEKHAFTGANKRFIGRFEQADQSTLFLDEISEMNIDLQAKMLRFLQDMTFYRVGGNERLSVDVRLVSATNRDPMDAIESNMLREDLYYRLNVVNINLPPLRERAADIPLLAEHFMEMFAKENGKEFKVISDDAIEALSTYPWHGNIRELQNVIHRTVILHNDDTLELEMIPDYVRSVDGEKAFIQQVEEDKMPSGVVEDDIVPLEELEKRAIRKALKITKGHVSRAAVRLRISQTTLYRKLKEFEIHVKEYK